MMPRRRTRSGRPVGGGPRQALAILFLGLALAPAQAAEDTTAAAIGREGVLAAALANSASIQSARRDYESAKDKALYAASIWQSSIGLNGQLKGSLATSTPSSQSGPSAGASGSSSGVPGFAAGANLSVKPVDFLSVDASIDTSLAFKASLSVKPFADPAQARQAQQALEDQELKYGQATISLTAAIYKSWSGWAKAAGQLELARLSQESATRALFDKQLRFDAGALSASDLDNARATALQAAKDLADQQIAELQARYDLLNQAGLPLGQSLATPDIIDTTGLRSRVAAIAAGAKAMIPDTSLELARRSLERAKSDSQRVPSLFSGLGAGASLSGDAAGLGSWQVSLSWSVGASGFTPYESATRQRAVDAAAQSLAEASYQGVKSKAIALQRLQGVLSLAENAELQRAQATKSWTTEKTRFEAGSASDQKLAEATISKRRAELNAAAAWRELESELLSWQQ
jgi:outer membrane protein TolC